MAGEELRVGIRLTADGRDFVGAVREAARELDKLSRAAKSAGGVANGFATANKKMSDTLRVVKDAAIAYVTTQTLISLQNKELAGTAASAVQRTAGLGVALRNGAGAAGVLRGAMRVATVAVRGFRTALAFLTGPGGLILLGVSAIYDLVSANKAAKESVDGLPDDFFEWGESIDATAEKLTELGAAQKRVLVRELGSGIEAAKAELASAREEAEKARRVLSARELYVKDSEKNQDYLDRVDDADAEVERLEGVLSDLEDRLANTRTALDPGFLSSKDLDDAARKEIARLKEVEEERKQRTSDAAASLLQVERELQTDRERVIAEYQERIAAIEHPDAGGDAERKQELRERAEAAKQSALAEIEAADAADKANKERASGLPFLEALKRREAALLRARGGSTEALERETRAEQLRARVQREFSEATPEVIDKIVAQTQANEELEEILRKQTEARKQLLRQIVQQLEPLPSVTNDTFTQQDSDALRGYATGVDQVAASVEKYSEATDARDGAARAASFLDAVKAGTEGLAAHNRKAFRLNQAAAIAQAVIATHSAIAAVLGDESLKPTPIRFVFAGLMAAAGAAQIAAIRAQQPPQAYAYGGIIDSPTFFSHHGGLGLAGEAGPEAILPLRRLSSGRLGVEAVGGRDDIIFSPSIHVTVETSAGGDAYGIGSEVGLRIRRELEPLIRDVMVNERRPGGVLNPTDRVHAY
ncbi:MAG: hypothetical protein OXG81_11835 [Acidobacteria bacterium]|nr:hypothetical protein [Acidobacteriota bacterium]MCY3971107.1 hypothetical protein [Acidobacteriota bacterium]